MEMIDLIIELKVKGGSPLQVSEAIIEFYVRRQEDIEMALIDLEEFARHIFTSFARKKVGLNDSRTDTITNRKPSRVY